MPVGRHSTPEGSVQPTGISLSWPAVDGAAKYEVRQRESGTEEWTAESETTVATFTVSDLAPSTGYFFQVRATGDGSRYVDVRPGAWSKSQRSDTSADSS